MNKPLKIILATLGGINLVFNMLIPIAVALIIVKMYPGLSSFSQWIILLGGSLASFYKAISVAFGIK